MGYLSILKISEHRGISPQRIQILCSQEHISGAVCIDYSWAIPSNVVKTFNGRIKSGKYIKEETALEGKE